MTRDKNTYKKILVVSAGRINLSDTTNNGLLFRNLFYKWPKENIAQIYNSGDNNDCGFFGNYYKLGAKDRNYGFLYNKLHQNSSLNRDFIKSDIVSPNKKNKIISFFKRNFIKTGLYELIFKVKVSNELKEWVKNFNPDFILLQGYSLTFSELPLLIKGIIDIPLIFFTTDDWPTYLYNSKYIKHSFLSFFPRRKVLSLTNQIIENVEIPIAFGQPMCDVFTERYNKRFYSINHCDNSLRFNNAKPITLYDKNTVSLVTIGTFSTHRCPMIIDINECCKKLGLEGVNARLSVFSDYINEDFKIKEDTLEHVSFYNDPGNNELPSILKGADILVLIEGFDEDYADSIRLSISSKAHLYMFSGVPIIVYANSKTGIANYSRKYGWAHLIDERNIDLLVSGIKELLSNKQLKNKYIEQASSIAKEFHDKEKNQRSFYEFLLKD